MRYVCSEIAYKLRVIAASLKSRESTPEAIVADRTVDMPIFAGRLF